MKSKLTLTVKLSEDETFAIEATGIDQDKVEFRKDIRKLFLKRDAVKEVWREMEDEKTKDTKD